MYTKTGNGMTVSCRHDIYTHKDSGMMRVKPDGVGRGFCTEPHVSKSVLYKDSNGTGKKDGAFKVSNKGYAVPKSPDDREVTMELRQTEELKAAMADAEHTYLEIE